MRGPRLDEILIKDGLITEEQAREALEFQKEEGGRFGSQLLYHGYLGEADLVHALATQLKSEGVVLTDLDIPAMMIKMIPARIAIARKVIPFDYDSESDTIKIACEDPTNKNLIRELTFVLRGKTIQLYVAADLALNTAISRYYLGHHTPPGVNFLMEIPVEELREQTASEDAQSPCGEDDLPGSTVLLVSDDAEITAALKTILELEQHEVVTADSADTALELIGDQAFDSVLIKDTVSGDYIDLIDRLRKMSPNTKVRYYESVSSLLVDEDRLDMTGRLMLSNLEIFTSILATRDGLPSDHSGAVGRYTDKLCRQLGLPARDRLLITGAAYMHDVARYYYPDCSGEDYRTVIELTVKLLQSLNYDPVVVQILQSMYSDLNGKFTKRLPIERLGGNILTIVDLFCDSIPSSEKLSLDKFEAVREKFDSLVGKLFMQEVADAFVEMITDELLGSTGAHNSQQVMILAGDPERYRELEVRLADEGVRSVTTGSTKIFAELYERSCPDIIIVEADADAETTAASLDQLVESGIDMAISPTILLAEFSSTSQMTTLFKKGIEDIVVLGENFDLLVTKVQRLLVRIEAKRKAESGPVQKEVNTQGNLSDMNLIDLLQAFGPARKTARITVVPSDRSNGVLDMYLQQGIITFASLLDLDGPEAIYEAIGWSEGNWIVQPVEEADLPESENKWPIEAILMEACRLLDEKSRDEQSV